MDVAAYDFMAFLPYEILNWQEFPKEIFLFSFPSRPMGSLMCSLLFLPLRSLSCQSSDRLLGYLAGFDHYLVVLRRREEPRVFLLGRHLASVAEPRQIFILRTVFQIVGRKYVTVGGDHRGVPGATALQRITLYRSLDFPTLEDKYLLFQLRDAVP